MDQKYIRDNYKVIKESPWLGGRDEPQYAMKYFLLFDIKNKEYDVFSVHRYNPNDYNIEVTHIPTLEDAVYEYKDVMDAYAADSMINRRKKKYKPKIKRCGCKK